MATGELEVKIPTLCRAAVVENEGPNFTLEIKMVPVPSPGPNEVLIKLNATGVCYSDLHYMLNDTGGKPMSVSDVVSAGHEGAGVVVKLGANVSNFAIGDRVGVKPIWDVCGACELCWADKESHCSKKILTGVGVTGTFQHYLVSPAKYTTPIPSNIPDHIAASMMCSAATAYRALVSANLAPGAWVAFPGGAGGVGIQMVQLARAMGFRPIVIDTGSQRRALALEMKAEEFVDFREVPDATEEVVRLADGVGAHGVFVTAPAAYPTAINYAGTRIGAVIVCIGLPALGSGNEIVVNPAALILRSLTIKGSLVGTMQDTHAVLQFAKRGLLKQTCEIYPLDKLPEVVDLLRDGRMIGKAVIDFNA